MQVWIRKREMAGKGNWVGENQKAGICERQELENRSSGGRGVEHT